MDRAQRSLAFRVQRQEPGSHCAIPCNKPTSRRPTKRVAHTPFLTVGYISVPPALDAGRNPPEYQVAERQVCLGIAGGCSNHLDTLANPRAEQQPYQKPNTRRADGPSPTFFA